jgi:hypothetical protein
MSEFQVVTGVATIIGLVATVLNLTLFFREKEKAHVRAGLVVLLLLTLGLGVLFLPRYAPGLVAHLPQPLAQGLTALSPAESPTPKPETPAAPPLQGSFSLELHRNLLGGVDSLNAKFQFANLGNQNLRVTAYQLKLLNEHKQVVHSYYRVLTQPVELSGLAAAEKELELDAEIRDHWLSWQDQEQHGPVEMTWEAHDPQGQVFRVSSSNG